MTVSTLLAREAEAAAPYRRALVVDLDGSLVRTDTLVEIMLAAALAHPLRLLRAFTALRGGRARFKQAVSELVEFDPALLPYNEDLLTYLREEQKQGSLLILATGADRRIALAVAEHLDLFDAVLASDGATNLKGAAKLRAIRETLGDRPFAYVGNERADLAVWREADAAIVAGGPGLARRAAAVTSVERTFPAPMPWPAALLRAMRPHQWVKNFLVFVPILTARGLDDFGAWTSALLMFAAFSATASGIYLVNDLCDLAADRQHPEKRARMLASGTLPALIGLLAAPLLVACGLALAATVQALPIILIYAAASVGYSLYFKSQPLVDVFMLAGLYTIRLIGGGAAAGERYHVSLWLLAFSSFLFLSLALVKRVGELQVLARPDKPGVAGRGYRAVDVPLLQGMGIASSFISSLVLALYVQSELVVGVGHRPTLAWVIVPLLLFWQCRIWLATARGRLHRDPIVFAARDWVSWLVAICSFAALLFGSRVGIVGM